MKKKMQGEKSPSSVFALGLLLPSGRRPREALPYHTKLSQQ